MCLLKWIRVNIRVTVRVRVITRIRVGIMRIMGTMRRQLEDNERTRRGAGLEGWIIQIIQIIRTIRGQSEDNKRTIRGQPEDNERTMAYGFSVRGIKRMEVLD